MNANDVANTRDAMFVVIEASCSYAFVRPRLFDLNPALV